MNKVLARLRTLLLAQLLDAAEYVRAIQILDSISKDTLTRLHHLPAVVISPSSERHEPGPFVNTAREYFEVSLLIIAQSAEILAYQVEAISGTPANVDIYKISEKIREILYANKKLVDDANDKTFEMRDRFDCTEIQVGDLSSQRITIEYTSLELYTGMQNKQDSLSLSAITF